MIRSVAASAIVLALVVPCAAAPAEQKKEPAKVAAKAVKPAKPDPKAEAKPAGKVGDKAADKSEKPVEKVEDKHAQVQPKLVLSGPIVPSEGRLARISDTLNQGPVTHAVTKFGEWSVACEIQAKVKACFASTYYGIDGVVMKLKVGPTELDLPAKPRKRGTERYVLSIEGPQGLDPEIGYSVVSGKRSGVIPLGADCDKDGCRSFIDVSDDGGPVYGPEQKPGLVVLGATRQGRAFVWRFSGDGFLEAFDKMKEETRPAGPSDEEIKARREAEVAEAKAREEREKAEAEVKAAALRAKATGVAGGWETGKVAEVSDDGRKIRVIDISADAAAKAAAAATAGASGVAASALIVPNGQVPAAAPKRASRPTAKPRARAVSRQVERPFVPRS